MIAGATCFIIGLIWISTFNDFAKWVYYLFFSSLILLFIGFAINIIHNDYEIKTWRNQLESLKDNTFLKGNINLILGSGEGKIEQKFEYTMYMRTVEGAKLLRLPVEKCKIVYADKPEIETIVQVSIPPTNWTKYFWLSSSENVIIYNIRVPRNTIDGEFKLDAQ